MGLLKMIRRMDVGRMCRTASKAAGESGKPAPLIFCDMVWCGLRYRAGYLDYDLFQFWDKTAAQRATVLTRGKNDRYVGALNDRSQWSTFGEKTQFLTRFAPYVGRRWLDLDQAGAEELERFARDLGRFVVKPKDGTHGDGVEILRGEEIPDYPALHRRLREEKRTLCEEVIVQHPDLNVLWSGSVNTIRVVTILKENTAHVICAYLRVGGGERPVDNFNGGGMVAPVDRETGVILCPARDKAGNLYECHPRSGARFEGARVPLWSQVLELVQKAALVVPTVRYVGWDVAVTPDGPLLVEGNQYPGHDIYGLPGQSPDKTGLLPRLEEVVPYRSLR